MEKKRIHKLALSLPVPALILLLRPINMTMDQGIVLSALVLTITWWATGVVKKSAASVFLLAVFAIWGRTPMEEVFRFPLSANFILIVFSFIFTEGIMNSGLTGKLIEPVLQKGSRSIHSILWMIITLNFILIFVIPQPFARIIILGMILKGFFLRRKLNERLIQILMLFTFVTAVVVNMMFIRGDIILNNALIAIAGLDITEALWMKIMVVPTSLFVVLTYLLFFTMFKKELSAYPEGISKPVQKQPLSGKERRNLWLIGLVVLVWMTEPIHGLGSTIVIVAGTILMAGFGLLKLKDAKSVNLELLLFITAAFSIGGVMTNSGVAQILFSPLSDWLPKEFGIGYILIVMVLSVAMHMVLGSNITTLSVVVPSLMLIGEGVAPMLGLVFVIHVSVCTHYMLPFHNVILIIGNGKEFFESKLVARYGLALTFLLPIVLLGVYYTWWRMIGLM